MILLIYSSYLKPYILNERSICDSIMNKRSINGVNIDMRKNNLFFIGSIGLLLAFAYFFAADMFVPSLPAMAKHFGVNSELARMSIGIFFVSLAFSQLLYGPASDRFGRKPIILIGVIIYILGAIICLAAHSIDILLCGRVIQGLGAGALMALSRTLIQDRATKEQFVKLISILSIFFLIAPALAPVAGGFIETYLNWRANFGIMLAFGLFLFFVVCFLLQETNQNKNPKALSPNNLTSNYFIMIKNIDFLILVYIVISALSGIVVFYTIGPFLLITKYHISPKTFGLISLLIVSFALAARILSSTYLLKHYSSEKILTIGLKTMIIGALIMLTSNSIQFHPVIILLLGLCFYSAGSSLVTPIASSNALSMFSKTAGACGALFGFLQMGGLFMNNYLSSILPPTEINLALILCGLSVTAYIFLQIRKNYVIKKHKNIIYC